MPKKKTTEETITPAPAPEPTPADLVKIGQPGMFVKQHPLMSVIVDVTDESGAVIRTESYIVSAQLKMTAPDRAADLPSIGEDVKNFVGSMFAVGSGGPSLDVEARMVRSVKVGGAAEPKVSLAEARALECGPSVSKKASFVPTFAKVPKPKHEPK